MGVQVPAFRPESPAMSVEEHLRQAEEYKEKGNSFYKAGELKKALGSYHKVLLYVKGLQLPPGDGSPHDLSSATTTSSPNRVPKDRVADVQNLMQTTRLNMAACYLQVGEFQKCVDACNDSLGIGRTCKALFRRGQAYMELRNFAAAKTDLEAALELSSEDDATAVKQQLRRLKETESSADADERAQWAKMFPPAAAAKTSSEEGEKAAPSCEERRCEEDAGAAAAAPRPQPESSCPDRCDDGTAAAKRTNPTTASGGKEPTADENVQPPSKNAMVVRPADHAAPLDEARKFDVSVRGLTYAWQQEDDAIKIYIPFDQAAELQSGVDESRVEVEFGEWSVRLQISSLVDGSIPWGLRLGDFHKRIATEKSTCTVRGSRITLKLVKQAREHWFCLLQNSGGL